jgi:hypothetical protein
MLCACVVVVIAITAPHKTNVRMKLCIVPLLRALE